MSHSFIKIKKVIYFEAVFNFLFFHKVLKPI